MKQFKTLIFLNIAVSVGDAESFVCRCSSEYMRPATLLKRDPKTGVFLCAKFLRAPVPPENPAGCLCSKIETDPFVKASDCHKYIESAT